MGAVVAAAGSLNVGDFVALETGDYRRPQREGGGSTHAFLLVRVMEQRGSGGKGYVVADDLLRQWTTLAMRGPASPERHSLSYLSNRRFPQCVYGARTFAILRAVPNVLNGWWAAGAGRLNALARSTY